MKKFRVALGVLAVAGALCVPAFAIPGLSSSADKNAISALIEKGRVAFEARDVRAIMENYAPGNDLYVFDAMPPRAYPNWDEYRKDWEGLFAMFPGPVKSRISDVSITVDGSFAYSHYIEDTRFTGKDGAEQQMVVRVTDVYHKSSGKWLIVHEHVSWPVDPATGKADFLSKP